MTYLVANTYKGWDQIGEPFDVNGKQYINVQTRCPRCGGKGIFFTRIENGHGVPAQPDNGMCYECYGEGIARQSVRVYSEKEFEAMERAKVRRRERAEEKRNERIKQAQNTWAERNGFDEDGNTWVFVSGNTYAIKDTLKAAGYKFNHDLGWHGAECLQDLPDGYKIAQFTFNELYEFNEDYVTIPKFIGGDAIKEYKERFCAGEYVGEVGERLRALKVQFVQEYSFDGYYGRTNVYEFDYKGNILVWMTNKYVVLDEEVEWFELTGTVKKHETYKGKKQTYLSRCVVKEID